MRLCSGIVLIGSLGAASCGAPPRMTEVQRLHVLEEVHAAVADRFEAMNRHDPEAVAGFYRPGEDFVYAGVSDVVTGLDGFSAMTAPWYGLHSDQVFEYDILHTQVLSPTVATVTIRGGTGEAPHLLWTNVYVLEAGRWLVALEHESWPGAPAPSAHP